MRRVAVTGHRQLTAEVAALVSAGVDAELDRLAATGSELVGVSCLADGADQIFALAVLSRGGSIEAIVPAELYRDGIPDGDKPAYDALLGRAGEVYRCDHRESTSEAHMDASRLMIDKADHLIAVWDGQPARGYAGTADVVEYARGRGVPVSVVWPEGAYRTS